MPELPDVEIYIERLRALVGGEHLRRLRVAAPWVLRSVDPAPSALEGRRFVGFTRIGKRIVAELEGEHFAVIHLMIAGRLRWRPPGTAVPRRRGLAAFDTDPGTLLLTEEGTRKRASIHLVAGRAGLAQFERGGIEPLEASAEAFAAALTRERHTLKRALTDPRIVSGIGGAYADEIMHRAGLSPIVRTDRLTVDDLRALHGAAGDVLRSWTDRLRAAVGDGFPEKVTAFHPEMAVHGRFGLPCGVCGAPVQRIAYADHETNYCPGCQTGGKILADRALSRLLKEDFPRTVEELEG
jgi:formamidopyrimidine-DNA glycosylase